MDNEKIGNFIRILRKEKGYTQKDLAKRIGVTDRAVSKWERGLGCPDVSLLEDLSSVLDVSISELLKGYRQDVKISNQDLIDSMYSQKKITIDMVKNVANYVTIISVVIFSFVIIVTNVKSINILYKKYYMNQRFVNNYEEKENYLEYQEKVNYILEHKGKYNDSDYSTIWNYMNIMSHRLKEMNHKIYIEKDVYTYQELLQFFVDQSNLFTLEINNMDLYQILIQYDSHIYKHIAEYNNYSNNIKEEFFHLSNFFVSPYHDYRQLRYSEYFPNVYNYLGLIYRRELILCNDIIRAGDMK